MSQNDPTDHATDHSSAQSGEEMIALVRESYDHLRAEISKVIVGQDEVVDQILMAIFSRGHAMLVGVPGLAKTLVISTIAQTMDLGFSRVQFTPDLMPSDITGTEVIEEDKATGKRALRFVQGPIFSNVILADEINRTPPKTQAALLEAMQERQVTAGGTRHTLPDPFFVLATQNPLEQEGTYPLPEAQLDRFMFQILVQYPTEAEELEVIKRSATKGEQTVQSVIDAKRILEIQQIIKHTPVPDHVCRYALRLVRATRVNDASSSTQLPDAVRDYVSWGAGPRASEALVHAAKAHAMLVGDGLVTVETIRAIAMPVLRHRVVLNFNAQADQVTPEMVINNLLESIPADGLDDQSRAQVRSMIDSGS
ncbi:MAG: AAA family ATPase [Phycisphaerales bacterium]